MPKPKTAETPPFCYCSADNGVGHFWHDTTCPPEPVDRPLSG